MIDKGFLHGLAPTEQVIGTAKVALLGSQLYVNMAAEPAKFLRRLGSVDGSTQFAEGDTVEIIVRKQADQGGGK
jgi:hypothetical protein